MRNNFKPKVHKQSEYFTIMLVPHSSGKTRSLRIPLMAFYMVLGIISLSLLCFGSFVFATNHFRDAAESAYSDLEQSAEVNSQLKQETRKLSDLLSNEKREAEKANKKQQESYEEIIHSYETYYKDKADELEQKLEELDKAREEIYNILSKKSYLPSITPVSGAGGGAQTVFLSTGGTVEEMALDMAARYEGLEREVNNSMLELDYLMGEMENIKPYLENYPTAVPVRGPITSEHAYRANPFSGRGSELHEGIDIGCSTGTSVRATGGGRVIFADWYQSYGYTVHISHGFGLVTRYAHNSQLLVQVGDTVSRGDTIAKAGSTGRSTGPHVHYEVIQNGTSVNPRKFIE